MSSQSNDNNQGFVDPKLAMEALVGEMRRMIKPELDLIHERLDRVENTNRGRERVLPREVVFDEFDELDMEKEDNKRFRGKEELRMTEIEKILLELT